MDSESGKPNDDVGRVPDPVDSGVVSIAGGDVMKVTVTAERDCCDPREDFLTYRGRSFMGDARKPKFCKHCGQLWYLIRFTDAAGDSDSDYVRFIPQIESSK
jgi:hypothetical protein